MREEALALELSPGVRRRDDVERLIRERMGRVGGTRRQRRGDPLGRHVEADRPPPRRQRLPAEEGRVRDDVVGQVATIELAECLLRTRQRPTLEDEHPVEVEQETADAGQACHGRPR